MLHPLEHVCDHQNPLADTPTLASRQAPQLSRPRFAAKKVCRHTPSPKHGTLAHQLYHIWGSPEAGITLVCYLSRRTQNKPVPNTVKVKQWLKLLHDMYQAIFLPDCYTGFR